MKINPGQLPKLEEALWGQVQAAVRGRNLEVIRLIQNAVEPIGSANKVISAEIRKLEEKILALPEEVRVEIEKALAVGEQLAAAVIDPEELIRQRNEAVIALIRTERGDNEEIARRVEDEHKIRTSAGQVKAMKAALTTKDIRASQGDSKAKPKVEARGRSDQPRLRLAKAHGAGKESPAGQEETLENAVRELFAVGVTKSTEIAKRLRKQRIFVSWQKVGGVKTRLGLRTAPQATPTPSVRSSERKVRGNSSSRLPQKRGPSKEELRAIYAAIEKIVHRGEHDTAKIREILDKEYGLEVKDGRVISNLRSRVLGLGIFAPR